MTSFDYGMEFKLLKEEVELLKAQIASLVAKPNINDQDWDNAKLMKEWGICLRTTANHRKNGLDSYKRGGRIYYTPEARAAFEKGVNKKRNSPEDLTASQNSRE